MSDRADQRLHLASSLTDNDLNMRGFQRYLRAAGRSPDTIKNYLEAVRQLAAHAGERDLLTLRRIDVQEYLGDLLDRLSAGTASTRYKALRQFYAWAVDEELIPTTPMTGIKEPKGGEKAVPVLADEQLRALLHACDGRDFEPRRDTAIIRLMCEPGGLRRGELIGIELDDVDLNLDVVRVVGKGNRERVVPFGAKTGQALERYLRVRARHKGSALPALWISYHGRALTGTGLNQMFARRGEQAGIGHVHPHMLRHTAAHVWLNNGGHETDAMRLFGWRSRAMLSRYGSSVADERAREAARRMNLGDRI